MLTFQLSNDFHVRKVMRNYLPNDEESKHYACLLQWDNIYYQAPSQDVVSKKTTVRVGLVQWQMRSYRTIDDLSNRWSFSSTRCRAIKATLCCFLNTSTLR